ncbi:MAG: glucuronosyltransferase [Pseudomonadota bacterium]
MADNQAAAVGEDARPKTVVLFSGHHLASGRKAGFHWIADAFHRSGWEVLFVASGLSPVSKLRRDYRLALFDPAERNRVVTLEPRLHSLAWWTGYHPANLKIDLLNALSMPLMRRWKSFALPPAADPFVKRAELFIVESAPAISAVPELRRRRPNAKIVYRVSDDLRTLRVHPVILEAERDALPAIDLVSVPSPKMLPTFARHPNAVFHRHGLRKELFEVETASPYPPGSRNAVSVGNMLFDPGIIDVMAAANPDWTFHLIGQLPQTLSHPNVRYHGELPFDVMLPYVLHAEIGLAPYRYSPGSEYLAHTSNKLMQYGYAGLQILAPDFIASEDAASLHTFDAADPASIRAAFTAAATAGKAPDRPDYPTWTAVMEALLRD